MPSPGHPNTLDEHLATVLRYVERNALRAGPAARALREPLAMTRKPTSKTPDPLSSPEKVECPLFFPAFFTGKAVSHFFLGACYAKWCNECIQQYEDQTERLIYSDVMRRVPYPKNEELIQKWLHQMPRDVASDCSILCTEGLKHGAKGAAGLVTNIAGRWILYRKSF